MDPFDEFEFKPLTDGLGFHKKKSDTPPATTKTQNQSKIPSMPLPTQRESFLKDSGFSLLEEEAGAATTLTSPLPRKSRHKIENFQETKAPSAVDDILKNLQKNLHSNLHFEKETTKENLKTTRATDEYKATTWNFSSSFLDGMLVLASSLLCMIILLVITHVDLIANLTRPDESGMVYIATASLFFTVTFIYMVLNRAFLGCTPGEWAFDQRVGKPEDMQEATYTLRIIARTLVTLATGFIVLPLISLLTGKDAAGSLSGAFLYKKA